MSARPWYVITGGPCSGKTTLIRELAARGYRVVEEVARGYIEEKQRTGKTLEEVRRDEAALQRTLLARKVEIEKTLPHDEIVFFDRGIVDSVAYFALAGIPDDGALHEALKSISYRKVFFLALLPYVNDPIRREDPQRAALIHEKLRRAYEATGIEIVDVPVLPVDERADLVLAHL